MHKTTYDFNNKFIIELVKTLQLENKFSIKIKADKAIKKQRNVQS